MSVESISTGRVLDVEGALSRLDGDNQLFLEMARFYFEDSPPLLRELVAAVASRNAPGVRMKAHAIKGLVAGCGGVRAAAAAQRVENETDLTQVPKLVESLGEELELLSQALRAYRG
jgi:HPt (histidine-containing phosphotransfer) domain-containing protein